jgi:hypothetical protein
MLKEIWVADRLKRIPQIVVLTHTFTLFRHYPLGALELSSHPEKEMHSVPLAAFEVFGRDAFGVQHPGVDGWPPPCEDMPNENPANRIPDGCAARTRPGSAWMGTISA